MTFATICSGINAPHVAWNPLGWREQFCAEIDPFPCKVLAHHFPTIPNYGDITKFHRWEKSSPDIICGGTPCQAFSIAGLRKGLDDPRGNLTLTYVAILNKYMPRWMVWENVAGVLSHDKGRTFGTFLGGLAKLGYGFAYRILDAQYVRTCAFRGAVPQSRRRVFVIGYLGDWRRAAAVLFDRESMSGNYAPCRESRKETPFAFNGGAQCSDSARNLKAKSQLSHREDSDTLLVAPTAVSSSRIGVRRLTPLECERLMGFPDGFTAIPSAKDGPRYKAIGNSMCVNVMQWIGERIQLAENLCT